MRKILNLSAVLFGLIVILLAGLNRHVHVNLRDAAIAEATDTLQRQVQIQAQEIGQSLQSIRFKLEQLALQVELAKGDTRIIHQHLKAAELALPYVRAVSVVGPDGWSRESSRGFPAQPVPLADRDNIKVHLENPGSTLFIGGIARNKVDGKWQFSMSLAVRGEDGRLLYIIASVIDPYAYAETFRTTSAPEDFVTLIDPDFLLMARSPWREESIGTSLANAEAYRDFIARGADFSTGVYANLFSGEQRVVAVQRVFEGRLIVSTSRPLATALQGWRSLAAIISVISAAILMLGIGIGFIAFRFLAMREREAAALAELNRDLQEQTARAERAAAVKSDFLATMSHEIRTPMNGVLGMTQAMERLPLEDNARDYLSIIRDSSESLLGVINDILDFSRLEAGKLKIEAVDVRLAPLLQSLEAIFAPACEQKKLALRIELAPGTPAVIATDHMRLRQILMNLVGNAVKFTSAGHVLVWVKPVKLPDGGDAVRFEIEDTGIGVSPEALPHLFERFSQEDTSIARRFGGTGLGLAICKRLCELLGGRIGCRSEKNAGSVFWIELPTLMGDEAEPAAAAPPPSTAANGKLRILAVDDNRVNRRILDVLLQPFGHAVTFATSGLEALSHIERQAYDVVLLDIHMPEMDGFETLRRLRRLAYGRQTRVVALTADVVPEATVRYSEAGFDDVVAKPVVLGSLLAALAPRRWAAPVG